MTAWAMFYNLLPESTLAKYWNKQWKRSNAFWDYGKNGSENVKNVLQFTSEDWKAVDELIVRIGHLPERPDARVKFVMSRLQTFYKMGIPVSMGGCYDTDSDLHHTPEYWQSPSETLSLAKGDCDDWGILLYAVLRRIGVPAFRLKAELTQCLKQGKDDGLHFNLIYLAREDYEWYTIEGTYYPEDAIRRFLWVPRKDSVDHYGNILFTFNEEYTWAQHDFTIKPSFKTEARGG